MKKVDNKKNFSQNEKDFVNYRLPYNDDDPGSTDTFIQEVTYQATAKQESGVPLYNKAYRDILYGKVDKLKNPILPLGTYIVNIEKSKTNTYALNFVADAYNEFLSKWNTLVNKGAVDDNFFDLNLVKGHESIENIYENYLRNHYEKFILFLENTRTLNKIKDFDSFLNRLFEYMHMQIQVSSFSLSGFEKTKECPDSISGLSLILEDIKNTYQNKSEYINNKYFLLLKETLYSCGFSIDKNQPWKIYFRLDSHFSKKYINKYKKEGNIYELFFVRTDFYDLFYFQKIIFNLYNSFVEDNRDIIYFNHKICNDELVTRKRKDRRQSLDEEYIEKKLSSKIDYRWWKFYSFIKILEGKKGASQDRAEAIARETYHIYRKLDISEGLRYLEKRIAEIPTEIKIRKKLKL